jgi:ribosome-binding protein aMBF1 (putative translation factor)
MDEKSEDGKKKKEKGKKRGVKEKERKRVELKEMSYMVGRYVGYVRAARYRRGLCPL